MVIHGPRSNCWPVLQACMMESLCTWSSVWLRERLKVCRKTSLNGSRFACKCKVSASKHGMHNKHCTWLHRPLTQPAMTSNIINGVWYMHDAMS
jgi:hypothetical protein